ncbi:uncharacterized protein B0P05DRAFT_624212 [Gilbertella persicaria]|uniref:uncharacterized protein n=1 Tax=Gilbertella persicaria TaxID=101096 RepID=UPI00221EA130|nr:uncharacterized protein B0P05DRAFT_624212 [Gilbertella persicaria]KAI8061853.1 hypothetical protein B0P05DRAFT_624212 [Gilbertella persicaria]
MERLYSFYDSVTERETFHIQSEWLGNKIDLDSENNDNIDYCLITITNTTEHWTCKITRELLLENFKVSNALVQKQRNNVLTAAFQGEQSICGDRLEWRVTRDKQDQDKLQMKLRTYDGDIALTAGLFLLDKVPESDSKELHASWFKNCAIASRTSTEICRALQQRTLDIEKTCNEYKQIIEAMTVKMNQSKFIMLDKFTNLLNAKKRKARAYKNEYKKPSNKRLRQEVMDTSAKSQHMSPKSTVSTSLEVCSQIHKEKVIKSNHQDDDSDFSEDGIDCPRTVR